MAIIFNATRGQYEFSDSPGHWENRMKPIEEPEESLHGQDFSSFYQPIFVTPEMDEKESMPINPIPKLPELSKSAGKSILLVLLAFFFIKRAS